MFLRFFSILSFNSWLNSIVLKRYLEYLPNHVDIIIDNASVKRIPGICGTDLLRNGDFESNGKFWRRYGDAYFDIVQTPTSSKALKIVSKVHPDHGVYQDLFIDKDCFEEKDRFKISGEFVHSLE